MNPLILLRLWSVLVGAMDACTGALLVLAPAWTLRLMGVPPVTPSALLFLSWMGIFIAAIGLSYGLVFRGPREAEAVWIFTSGVRTLVAIFVAWKIMSAALPTPWCSVAISDGLVAAAQWLILKAGWWKGAAP